MCQCFYNSLQQIRVIHSVITSLAYLWPYVWWTFLVKLQLVEYRVKSFLHLLELPTCNVASTRPIILNTSGDISHSSCVNCHDCSASSYLCSRRHHQKMTDTRVEQAACWWPLRCHDMDPGQVDGGNKMRTGRNDNFGVYREVPAQVDPVNPEGM